MVTTNSFDPNILSRIRSTNYVQNKTNWTSLALFGYIFAVAIIVGNSMLLYTRIHLRDVSRSQHLNMPFLRILKAVLYTVLTTTVFVNSNTIIAMNATCYVLINQPEEYIIA